MPYPSGKLETHTHASSHLLNFQKFYRLVEVSSLKLDMELVFTLLKKARLQIWAFLHPSPSPAPETVVRHLAALLSLQCSPSLHLKSSWVEKAAGLEGRMR